MSNKSFKRIRETLAYTSGESVYKTGRDCAHILFYEEPIDDQTRIIVYKDVERELFQMEKLQTDD